MEPMSLRKVHEQYMDVRNEIRDVYQLIFRMRQNYDLSGLSLTPEKAERILEDLVRRRDALRAQFAHIIRNSNRT